MKLVWGLSCVMLAMCQLARADAISVLPGSNVKNQSNAAIETRTVSALPYQDAASALSSAGTSSGQYNFQNSALAARLNHLSEAATYLGRSSANLSIMVGENTPYRLATSFLSGGGDFYTAYIDLLDVTTGNIVFSRLQYTGTTPHENVVPTDGSSGNQGLVIGNLIANHNYLFRYILVSEAGTREIITQRPGEGGEGLLGPGGIFVPRDRWLFGDSGAVTGDVTLLFGGVPVPLPPAVWGGLALLGLLPLKGVYRLVRGQFESRVGE